MKNEECSHFLGTLANFTFTSHFFREVFVLFQLIINIFNMFFMFFKFIVKILQKISKIFACEKTLEYRKSLFLKKTLEFRKIFASEKSLDKTTKKNFTKSPRKITLIEKKAVIF